MTTFFCQRGVCIFLRVVAGIYVACLLSIGTAPPAPIPTPRPLAIVVPVFGRCLSEQYDPQKDYGSYTIHGGEVNEK